jgi:hypothetical protein
MPVIAEIPASVYAALAALMFAVTAVLQEWLRARREKAAADVVARQVKEVKERLEVKDAITDKKLDDIHKLVNKPLATALKAVALAYRERAGRPDATEADQRAADAAEQDYRDHEQQQALVEAATTKKLKDANDT